MSSWLYMPLDPMRNEPNPFPTVVRCDGCGLGSLSPLPVASEIGAFYDLPGYYTHGGNDPARSKPSIADKALSKLANLADRSEPFDVVAVAQSLKPNARICDLGCGYGDLLRQFKDLGFDVVGVDPDPSARERAKSSGVMVLEGTAEDIPADLGAFDLVLMTHALEHCRNPKAAVENAFRLTKPGGRCYIEVPNCASEPFKTFTVSSAMFDAPRHIHFFTPDALAGMVERVGFDVDRRSFIYYERNFDPTWRAWERQIAERSGTGKRHTFAASVSLFLRSFLKRPELKYDSFGLTLSRPTSS